MPTKTGPKIGIHATGRFYTTLIIEGKKMFFYGSTKEEVLEKYIEAKHLHNQGYNVRDNPSMKEYTIRWFNLYKKGKGALKTQEMYANAVNVHIIPALGDKKIKDITTSDIQKLLNDTDSSKSLQHKVRITLNQIFKKAQADRLVAFNPVTGVDPVETPPPVRQFYSPEQREILIDVLHDHKVFPLALSILNTGMRVTEAIALMRQRDLDLENKKIYVRESTEFERCKPKIKETKTGRGVREIPIPSAYANWLNDYLQKKKSLYVFPGHHGGQMGQTELRNMQRRANEKLQKWFDEHPEKEERRFKLHFKTLRHTYCTELYDLDIDEVSAAAIMGHSVTIMREIYTHIQKERQVQTGVKIEQLHSDKITPTPNKN